MFVQSVRIYALIAGFITVMFAAAVGVVSIHDATSPDSLDHDALQQVSKTTVYDNVAIWHVNGSPVFSQRRVVSAESKLFTANFLSYTNQHDHHTKSVRSLSERGESSQKAKVRSVLALYSPDLTLPENDLVNHKPGPIFSQLIDPKRYLLDVQSRWGVRLDAERRSSIIRLIHTALIKEEAA